MPEQSYRIRVVDFRIVDADELVPARLNPRRHPRAQRQALKESIERYGVAGAELTRMLPDGRLELIDGEARKHLLSGQKVPVLVTDLSEDEAQGLLARYDAITLMAVYDQSRSEELATRLAHRDEEAATLLRAVTEQNAGLDLLRQLEARDRAETTLAPLGGTPPWDGDEGDVADDAGENGADGDVADFDDFTDDGSEDGPKLGTDDSTEADDDDLTWSDEETDAALLAARMAARKAGSASAPPPLYEQDAVLDAAMAHFRSVYGDEGFPYRNLPVFVSMQRINQLRQTDSEKLLRSVVGVDVADTYHPHRYHGSVDGMNSPYQSFHEDKLLRHALRMRYEDAGVLKDGYVTTLNVVNHTQACSNFRPGFALALYRRFTQPGDTVLDTSTGYGGRLVGFMASDVVVRHEETGQITAGRYIGIDPNTLTHAGNTRMASDLGFAEAVELHNSPAEDVEPALLAGRCDFALTSPPYFARERYSDEATQSWKRYGPDTDRSGMAWREGFLRPMLRLQFAALKPGAYSVINVADVSVKGQHYPLVEWTLDDAKAAGFEHVETLYFDLNVSFGLGHDAAGAASEPVLVLRKPAARSEVTRSTTPEPADVRAARELVREKPSAPLSLAQWMHRLYALSREEWRLGGHLGVWPAELADYLTRLCVAYSERLATIRVADGLLAPYPVGVAYRPETCVVLLSGGKDSIAAGMLAERAGYTVHGIYVRRVNKSYPDEIDAARAIAAELGWAFDAINPHVLPQTWGESVVKNQYCLALALDAAVTQLGFLPGALTSGSYRIDDCHVTSWYSDMQVAYDAFAAAIDGATTGSDGHGRTRYRALLAHEREAQAIWYEARERVQQLTASCMMPKRNKPQHRRRALDMGVPLMPYDCGACEKCYARAVLSADVLHVGPAYPAEYLLRARRRLAERFAMQLNVYAHPLLEAPDYPDGASASALLDEVYGRVLNVRARRNEQVGEMPVVERA